MSASKIIARPSNSLLNKALKLMVVAHFISQDLICNLDLKFDKSLSLLIAKSSNAIIHYLLGLIIRRLFSRLSALNSLCRAVNS